LRERQYQRGREQTDMLNEKNIRTR